MEQMILVVDDDEPSARLLGRYLESLGQSSRMVTSGAEALETLRDEPDAFAMVLLDLAMPGMSGYDVCRAIRADETLAPLPIIAITATVDADYLEEASDVGIDRVLTKPYSREELEAILTDFLGSA